MKTNLNKLFEQYINNCRYSLRRRPETVNSYEEVYKTFQKLMPKVQRTIDLTESNLNEFFKILQTRERIIGKGKKVSGVKDSTIRTYWSKLNSFFVWLKDRDYLEENPFEKMEKPKADYSDKKALHRKDVERIYTAIALNSKDTLIQTRDTLIISLLFYTGIRKTELISLKVTDIDFQTKMLIIRGETSKSKKTRRIPINEELMRDIKKYREARRKYKTEMLLVSSQHNTGITKHGIKHWVRRINSLSGVTFHLHMFRHTFACNMVKNKISTIKLMMLMGHTDMRMTQRYLRSIDADDLRDDINKMSLEYAW
jgi:integrase/recombinase XerD